MSEQPSNWNQLLKNQLAEKSHYQEQIKYDKQQRAERYKQELETDIILKQQKKNEQKVKDQQLESLTLNTLQQREFQKVKEYELRKVKQIETSLDNLNNLLIRKKMSKERNYQKIIADQQELQEEKLKEIRSLERQKMQKEHDKQELRHHYDSVLTKKQQLDQEERKQKLGQMNYYQVRSDQSLQKVQQISKYQEELNKQLEEKRYKLKELSQRKVEERMKVDQKLAYEKQKMLENKIKDYNTYKQYADENYQLLKNKSLEQLQNINGNELKYNWKDLQNKNKLPHIYCENYLPYDRNKQLQVLDRDLIHYSDLQQKAQIDSQNVKHSLFNPIQNNVISSSQVPPTQQSKKSKQSKQSVSIKSKNEYIEGGYAQIHQTKTQTPMSKKSTNSQQIQINSPQYEQKKIYNIITGKEILK